MYFEYFDAIRYYFSNSFFNASIEIITKYYSDKFVWFIMKEFSFNSLFFKHQIIFILLEYHSPFTFIFPILLFNKQTVFY